MVPTYAPRLLWIDSLAGLSVGALTLVLREWLSGLYHLPLSWLLGMGLANVIYGCFSFSLARSPRRARSLLLLLIGANATWALFCVVAAAATSPQASLFGTASLLLEGVFVGGLAGLEWRYRELLAPART